LPTVRRVSPEDTSALPTEVSLNAQFALIFALFVMLIVVAFAFALTFADWSEDEEIEKEESAPYSDEPTQQHDDQSTSPSSPDDKAEAKRRKRQKAYRSSQARLINVAAGLNVLTAVAAVAGLVALYILYGTLIATQEQFEASNRPYLFTRGSKRNGILVPAIEQLKGSKQSCVNFALGNEGNVPAYDVGMIATIWVGDESERIESSNKFIGPHIPERPMQVCTTKGYDLITKSIATDSEISMRIKLMFSYKGVSEKQYCYYADASYNKTEKAFMMNEEGDKIEPAADCKP
jgi:hypothetical protein